MLFIIFYCKVAGNTVTCMFFLSQKTIVLSQCEIHLIQCDIKNERKPYVLKDHNLIAFTISLFPFGPGCFSTVKPADCMVRCTTPLLQ